jgi:hypothetical protein
MTTHFHLVLRLIMCGHITFIPHYSFVAYIQIFLTLCIYTHYVILRGNEEGTNGGEELDKEK